MSAAGGSRAGHRPAGAASAAGAAGASSKKGVAAGAGAGAAGTASAASVAEKEAERSVDVRAILKKKEDEVKEMLAPEKEMYEIDSLVVKIVDEVRALESKGGEQGAENSDYTFLAAVETAPQFHCPVCGNRQQTQFMLDAKQGDTICLGADGDGCGAVVQDHKVHEGSMYRKFEGEADRSHHGPAPNRLYSTAHNMRTWISEGRDANRLRNLAEDVEMGLSTVGKQDERKTRTAYKDRMKREAFDLINHIAGNLDLHETVTVRAKELFAGWRNVKEHVHQKHAVICACIIAAYREVGTEELSKMFDRRQQEGVEGSEARADPLYPFVCPECKAGFNAAKSLDFHQKENHKSAAAAGQEVGGAGPPTQMSEWSLSDARGWLTSVVSGLELPAEHVKSICTWLETSLGAQKKGQKVGRKRKATRTAGQYLMMLSLARCTELCGGDSEVVKAAGKLHHEIRRKSAERSRKDKNRVASNHAAQRQNQNVRKPWVAHISAELDTASEKARKAGAAAAARETAAGAAAVAAVAAAASVAAAVPPGAAPAAALGAASAAPGAQAPGAAVASPVAAAAAAAAAVAGGGEATVRVQEEATAVIAAGVQTAVPAQVAAGVNPLGVAVGTGDRSEPVEIDLVG